MSMFSLSRLLIVGEINYQTPKCVLLDIADAHGIRYNFDQKLGNNDQKRDNVVNQKREIRVYQNVENDINHNRENKINIDTKNNIDSRNDIEGFPVHQLIRTINESPVEKVKSPYGKIEYRNIARFVNPHCKWKIQDLRKAFEFLWQQTEAGVKLPSSDFSIGLQTPENLYTYNACVLYKICQHYSLRTYFQTTIELMGKMVNHLRLSSQLGNSYLINLIAEKSPTMSSSSLINILSEDSELLNSVDDWLQSESRGSSVKVSPKIPLDSLDLLCLQEAHSLFNSTKNIYPRLDPLTNNEALILGALQYQIDLTDFSCPWVEFRRLREKLPFQDEKCQRIFEKNPSAFNLYSHFNPHFQMIYSSSDLQQMARNEGHIPNVIVNNSNDLDRIPNNFSSIETITNITNRIAINFTLNTLANNLNRGSNITNNLNRDTNTTNNLNRDINTTNNSNRDANGANTAGNSLELLQISYLSETFYHGFQLNITNKETPFLLEDLSDLENNSIVCYGSMGNKTLTAFRYSELHGHFSAQKNFTHPTDPRSTLESFAIEKLKLLSGQPISGESNTSKKERKELHNLICNIQAQQKEGSLPIRQFQKFYDSAPEPEKVIAKQIILLLFETGLYMRGWNQRGKFPIESVPVSVDQNSININVTQSINQFNQLCDTHPSIGKIIRSLPLLEWKTGTGYLAITNPERGLTLADRMEIVRKGTSLHSCIRITSNLFLVSAHRYMKVIGITPMFDVEKIRYIA